MFDDIVYRFPGHKQEIAALVQGEGRICRLAVNWAGLPEPFRARSCGCTQHNVFRVVW